MSEKQKSAPQTQDRAGQEKRKETKDPRQQEENRQRMGVGPDHKTESMKKGDRGTFP